MNELDPETKKALQALKEHRRVEIPKPTESAAELQEIPQLETLLDNAFAIVDKELRHIARKAKNCSLEANEAKVLQGYIKLLLDAKRQEREEEKALDLSQLNTSELIEKVKALESKNGGEN